MLQAQLLTPIHQTTTLRSPERSPPSLLQHHTDTYTFTTPSPTPTPGPTLYIQSLPAKADDASTKMILATGSLGRVLVQIPSSSILDSYAQANANGTWPESLAGFQVHIGTLTASMVSVKRIQTSTKPSYAIDFMVPDNAPIGTQVPFTLTQQNITTTWATNVNLRQTAPAFWSTNGTANGPTFFDFTYV